MKESFSIKKIFEDVPKKELGHNRHVLDFSLDDKDFILKETGGSATVEEVESLKFLNGLGIAENLLVYDNDRTLAIEKIDGDRFYDAKDSLIEDSFFKKEEENIEKKFKFKQTKRITLDDRALIEDKNVRKFCVDYLSKMFFMILNGLIHNDLKSDNIMVDKNGRIIFIDFGQARILNYSNQIRSIGNDLQLGFSLLENFNSIFRFLSKEFNSPVSETTTKFFSLVDTVYKKFIEDKIKLCDRPFILEEEISKQPDFFLNIFISLGIPLEISTEINDKILDLIKQYLHKD